MSKADTNNQPPSSYGTVEEVEDAASVAAASTASFDDAVSISEIK
jgi:hypothetical protein